MVYDTISPAVTEIDRNMVYSRCVENAEISRSGSRARARSPTMTKLNAKPEILKGN
jgi:hypothetical protein